MPLVNYESMVELVSRALDKNLQLTNVIPATAYKLEQLEHEVHHEKFRAQRIQNLY